MCEPRLKCSLGSLARLSTLSLNYLLATSICIFVLSSVYLVEYTLHPNVMIEIYTRNFDLHITVPTFCAETWTISPIQSIPGKTHVTHRRHFPGKTLVCMMMSYVRFGGGCGVEAGSTDR